MVELMQRPERRASADEIKNVDDLMKRAKHELAAEVFKQEPAEKAINDHPELAPAYAYMGDRKDCCGKVQ